MECLKNRCEYKFKQVGKMVKIGKFISQVKTEMKKVAWPSREELISSTIVVLVSMTLIAIYIGFCDLIFSRSVHFILGGVF
jgi:preprotein translocase subunit SecE